MASKHVSALVNGAQFARSAFLSRRTTVAYVGGWLGKHNLGDEALFSAYEALFPQVNLVHFNGGRVSQLLSRNLPGVKAGLLGGGTLIGPTPGFLRIARAFVKGGQKLIVFGTGVEDPGFWPSGSTLEEWRQLLERCPFIGVRGPISAEQLSSAGMKDIHIVGDPIVTFAHEEINSFPIPNSIGLNIGTSGAKVWGNEAQICEEMIALAKRAREAKWQVDWFVVWPNDLEITRRAAAASGTSERIHQIYDEHQLFTAEVRKLSAFVGMKLHATALATCALTPSVMLEYRPKCRDYMQTIGQGAHTFQTDRFRSGVIWELVQSWNANHAEAANSLLQGIQRMKTFQRQMASQVAQLIPSR
jgi:polysaccharide pyruvyl transferase WcaK-like protein